MRRKHISEPFTLILPFIEVFWLLFFFCPPLPGSLVLVTETQQPWFKGATQVISLTSADILAEFLDWWLIHLLSLKCWNAPSNTHTPSLHPLAGAWAISCLLCASWGGESVNKQKGSSSSTTTEATVDVPKWRKFCVNSGGWKHQGWRHQQVRTTEIFHFTVNLMWPQGPNDPLDSEGQHKSASLYVLISPTAWKLFQDAVLPPAANGDCGLCFFR